MKRALLFTTTALVLPAAAAAQDKPRVTLSPYIEASQVLSADLKGNDSVTYTSLAAGIDAQVDTARTTAQINYRYEHQFSWSDRIGDQDIHSGLARAQVRLTPGLSIDAGGIATRARSDIRGAAPGSLTGDVDNVSQVYGVYGGPSYVGRIGALDVGANYRIGYTKVTTPNYTTLAPGQRRLDYYDDSLGNQASVRAGIRPGDVLPIGITASAGYEREDAGQLDQRYEGYYGRGDILAPVSPTVAIVGGVGYEKIETSQRSPLVGTGGQPVVDDRGRFVTDPASPRRIAYRTDGVYYDVGVMWRPNRRTSIEGRVGERYGSISYTGSITYQASKDVGLAAQLYDGIQTFGRQLRAGVSSLPTSFLGQGNSIGQQYSGCTFGSGGGAPGGCLNDVFQSISTASYRARGIDAIIFARRGLNTFGFGLGYANRKLFSPDAPNGIVVYGLDDESWYAQAFWGHTLSPVSGVDANAFFSAYDSQLAGSDTVLSAGVSGTYYHYFGRLGATGTLGLYSFRVGDFSSSLSLQALLAARYRF